MRYTYLRLASASALGLASLVTVSAGPAFAAPVNTNTTITNPDGDWTRVCAKVDADTGQTPRGLLKFTLKDVQSGDIQRDSQRLVDIGGGVARACWNDIGDSLTDSVKYRIRALYPGADAPPAPSFDSSAASRTFTFQG